MFRCVLSNIRVVPRLSKFYSNSAQDSGSSSPNLRGARKVFSGDRGINHVTLLGRAGRDSEIRGTTENPVVTFPLATSYTLKTVDGEYIQKTEWHRISIFRPGLRDIAAQTVKKGDRVYLTGSISYSEYRDKNDIVQRVTNINVEDLINVSRQNTKFVGLQHHKEEQEEWNLKMTLF